MKTNYTVNVRMSIRAATWHENLTREQAVALIIKQEAKGHACCLWRKGARLEYQSPWSQ